MDARNRIADVLKLRCNCCQEFFRMITKEDWRQELYNKAKNEVDNNTSLKNAFLVFLCDLVNENVYYLPIQEYFIENPKEYERLENANSTMKLRIPLSNQITRENDQAVVQLSKTAYAFVNNRVRKIETTD